MNLIGFKHKSVILIEWSGFLNIILFVHSIRIQAKFKLKRNWNCQSLRPLNLNINGIILTCCLWTIANSLLLPEACSRKLISCRAELVEWLETSLPLNFLKNKLYCWKHTEFRQNPYGEMHFYISGPNVSAISWKKNTEIRQRLYRKMTSRTCIHESAIEALSFAQKIWFDFHVEWSSF